MKNKKLIIAIIMLCVILGVFVVIMCLNNNNQKKKDNIKKENITTKEYVAYVSINPLIRLNYKVSCSMTECDDPIIEDYELVNDDAKEIYKDIDIKNKSMNETVGILINKAKENNINVEKVHLYTNGDNLSVDVYYDDIKIEIEQKENLDDNTINEIIKEENYIEREVYVPITTVNYAKDFDLDNYVLDMRIIPDDLNKIVKIKIKGSSEIIKAICNSNLNGFNNVCEVNEVYGGVVVTKEMSKEGNYNTKAKFYSKNPEINIIELDDSLTYNINIIKR